MLTAVSSGPNRAPMKRLIPIVAVVVVSLLVANCRKAPPPDAAGPLPVNFVTVFEKDVSEWDEFTGRLEAVESVEIRPRVSGYITEIHFEAGAIIKKGDLLCVIDPRPYRADFDRAAAELDRTQAELKLAQIELNRATDLRAKNTISASEFDQRAATAQGASAAMRAAEAARNSAALNLEFTQVKSPIDGRVSDARITLGNLVQPGAGPDNVLTTVVSVDPIYAKMDADENAVLKYIELSKEGKRVSARTKKSPPGLSWGMKPISRTKVSSISSTIALIPARARSARASCLKTGTLLLSRRVFSPGSALQAPLPTTRLWSRTKRSARNKACLTSSSSSLITRSSAIISRPGRSSKASAS